MSSQLQYRLWYLIEGGRAVSIYEIIKWLCHCPVMRRYPQSQWSHKRRYNGKLTLSLPPPPPTYTLGRGDIPTYYPTFFLFSDKIPCFIERFDDPICGNCVIFKVCGQTLMAPVGWWNRQLALLWGLVIIYRPLYDYIVAVYSFLMNQSYGKLKHNARLLENCLNVDL